MAIGQVGSTTTVYEKTTVSKNCSSSSTVSSSRTSSATGSIVSSTTSIATSSMTGKVSYSSATAKGTCSTTVNYGGASSTVKVSSNTTVSISSSTSPSISSSKTNISCVSSVSPTVCVGDKYKGLTGVSQFFNISMDFFGFSGIESYDMYKLYEGIKEKYDEDSDYQFARAIASCVYGDKVQWRVAAGLMKDDDDIIKFMESNGLTESEATSLTHAIQNQALVVNLDKNTFIIEMFGDNYTQENEERVDYLYNQFDGYLDFAHMFATIACSLYENNDSIIHNIALTIGSEDLTIEEASGYGGDIFGFKFGEVNPSMNNGDYMADLDAVNIIGRMSETSDIMDAILKYYSDLINDKTNRAEEFVVNLGGSDGLEILREKIQEYEEKNDEEKAKIAWTFYDCIKNDSEVWQE